MSGPNEPSWGAGGAAPGITSLDIVAVATEVWQHMLGLELVGLDAAAAPARTDPAGVTGEPMRATVLISGAFEGSVSLELSDRAARHVAGVMFGIEPYEITPEDAADAIGELANMVGGNLKMLVERPAKLSLPAVALGPDAAWAPPEHRLVHRVAFGFAEDIVHIVVHARPGASPTVNPEPSRSMP